MKGISPLIAAVLLIAFTVAVATLVAGWFSTQVRTTTESVSNRTTEAVDCASASINIDDVFIKAGVNGSARAIIKNNGFQDDLTLTGIQAYNRTGHNFTLISSSVTDFDRGEIYTATISYTDNTKVAESCPGSFSQVIVTTSCGGVSDVFSKTPKCFT